MLHEKVFHINKNKVDVAQKSISCRQKQDGAPSKKYFVRKKSYYFFPERRPIASCRKLVHLDIQPSLVTQLA